MPGSQTLVIIHGWSDTYRSFARLGRELVSRGIAADVAHVRLGDYVSLDDDVTFDDLAHALQDAWTRQQLPRTARSVNVVVHSTGALVVRHWMTTFFTPSTNPIYRFLMLAPANFGSPLAHKGRSFVGRVVKGFKSDRMFQTGTHILKGLELASPFSWDLAQRDRFSSETWHGPGRVLATVLVGTAGYSGISAAANEDGTDGTVRVSTADLNPARVTLDFVADPQQPRVRIFDANGAV
ncbi:MAG: esterase/lipase family protein, partial [Vicinamibacteria bacterium]